MTAGRQTRGEHGRPLAPEVEAVVTGIGARGDGIADSAVGRLCIPFTAPGDRVRARLLGPAGNGLAAELVEVIVPSPDRVTPPCPHFGRCGGCALQHLADDAYVAAKEQRLAAALARARLTPAAVAPLARTPAASRRRTRFAAVGGAAGRPPRLGFHERHGRAVVDVVACPVLEPRIAGLLPPLRRLLARLLAPGQRAAVAVSLLSGGLDVVIEWPGPPDHAAREQLAALASASDLARLSWRRAADGRCEPFAWRRPVAADFGGVAVAVPPDGFVQPTAAGEAALVAAVLDAVGSAPRVADLFCGAGTFTLPLARAGARVLAIDADAEALLALAAAARPWPGVHCQRRELCADPLPAEALRNVGAVVLDPPRAGARAQAGCLARSAVPVIAAVSCHPESFARDARILVDGGYRLERIVPVDQFLWSAHLELVAVFRR